MKFYGKKQNYFIALLILLFSLLTPIIKIFFSLLTLIARTIKTRKRCMTFINLIGKWSMTDVFVVAILLAFFSANVDQTTDAWLGHGVYFFC